MAPSSTTRKPKAKKKATSTKPRRKLTKAEKEALQARAKQAIKEQKMEPKKRQKEEEKESSSSSSTPPPSTKRGRTEAAVSRSATKRKAKPAASSKARRKSAPLPKKSMDVVKEHELSSDEEEEEKATPNKVDRKKKQAEDRAHVAKWKKEHLAKNAASRTPTRTSIKTESEASDDEEEEEPSPVRTPESFVVSPRKKRTTSTLKKKAPVKEVAVEPSSVSTMDDEDDDRTIPFPSPGTSMASGSVRDERTRSSTGKKKQQQKQQTGVSFAQEPTSYTPPTRPMGTTRMPAMGTPFHVPPNTPKDTYRYNYPAQGTPYPCHGGQVSPPRNQFPYYTSHGAQGFPPQVQAVYGAHFPPSSPPDMAAGMPANHQPMYVDPPPDYQQASPSIGSHIQRIQEDERRQVERVQATQDTLLSNTGAAADVLVDNQEQQQGFFNDFEEEHEEDDATSNGRIWLGLKRALKRPAILVLLLAAWIGWPNSSYDASSGVSPSAGKLPPCFESSGDSIGEITEPPEWLVAREIVSCNSEETVPCPDEGVCSGGFLRACHGHNLMPSDAGDQCVLSDEAKGSIAKVEAAVVNKTVDYTCSLFGECEMVVGSVPMFDLKDVIHLADTEDVDPSLLFLRPLDNMRLKQENGTVLIGLTDDYVNNRLPLSNMCWFVNLVKSMFFLLGSVVVVVLSAVGTFVMKRPGLSVGVIAFSCIVWQVVLWRRKKALVTVVCQIAYSMLKANNAAYIVLVLRDEIAHNMHPGNRRLQEYVKNKVWPEVVRNIKRDHRVAKSHETERGEVWETWKWVSRRT